MSIAYRVDPDQLVAQFRGNPQALVQAAMSGQIDPTAAVLAGMQIRAAQNQQAMQGANPPTVAQDIFAPPQLQPQAPQQAQAPQGAVPPQGGMPPAGGLGATPPAMGAPQPPTPPQAPPMGMADGGMVPPYMQSGLDGIPVPDTMFDENRNGGFDDGYAGGGLVAFAGGGGLDAERLRRALIAQESGGDYGIVNTEGSGAMGAYQFMPETAMALAKRLGLPYAPELMKGAGGRSKKGREYQDRLGAAQIEDAIKFSGGDLGRAAAFHFAGPNEKGWKGKTRKYQDDIRRRYSGGKDDSATGLDREYTSKDPLDVPEAASVSELFAQLQGLTGKRGGEKTQAYLEAMQMSPERKKEMKRMNEAAALAAAAEAFGERGPLLGQIGKALGKASGTLAEGKKGIRAAELEGLKAGMSEEQQAYLDTLGLVDPTTRLRTAELAPREAALVRKGSAEEAERERISRVNEAALDRDLQREIAKARIANPSDFEQMLAISQSGTAEEKAALLEVLRLKQQYAPGAAAGGEYNPYATQDRKGGAGAPGAGGGIKYLGTE